MICEPDWLNAGTCIENARIAYDDSLCDDDGPVDTVISSGDLGVVLDLAEYAVTARTLIEAQQATIERLREALARARQVLATYQPEGAPTFYMETLWNAEAALAKVPQQ